MTAVVQVLNTGRVMYSMFVDQKYKADLLGNCSELLLLQC